MKGKIRKEGKIGKKETGGKEREWTRKKSESGFTSTAEGRKEGKRLFSRLPLLYTTSSLFTIIILY